MTITTATYERDGFPRATATLNDTTGRITCVLDGVTGLAPLRVVSREEQANGIDSLDPPTVHGSSTRDVIDRAKLALSAAADATLAGSSVPEIHWTRYYAAVSTKGALDLLGLDV